MIGIRSLMEFVFQEITKHKSDIFKEAVFSMLSHLYCASCLKDTSGTSKQSRSNIQNKLAVAAEISTALPLHDILVNGNCYFSQLL